MTGNIGVGVAIVLCLCLADGPRRIPNIPPITEPSTDGQILNPADVHMQAGPFSDPGGGTHASSTWELWNLNTNELVWTIVAATDPFLKIHVHLADGAFVGSYAGRTTLEFDTDYHLRVRFTNNLGETSVNCIRTFRTSVAGPPGVAGPMPWVPFLPGYRVERVASGFRLPVNIAFVTAPGSNPADPFFYVSELYGDIKVVRRDGSATNYNATNLLNYDPTALGSFPGAGEQGLAGICVAPNGDLYATMLHEVAGVRSPKVVRFTSADGGLTGTEANSLLMSGESQGPSHQISNISIGPDGLLYVHCGDGFVSTTAADLDSFQGKVLRMNLDLTPAAANPFYNAGDGIGARDYVFAYGLRNPFGGAWRDADGEHYEVENGPNLDRFARVVSGRNLGWDNTEPSMATFAIYNWSPAHAPVNLAFVQPQTFLGSGFPIEQMDRAFVTLSGPTYAQGPQVTGKRIVRFELASGDAAPVSGPAPFVEYTGNGQATVAALAAGPDGLYFSDLYKDQPVGAETPDTPGANILRVRYVGIPADGTGTGFEGEYFSTRDLTGPSVKRTDATIDFNWPLATQPHPSIPGDNFSVRWRGQIQPRQTDTVTFTTLSDDGVRLWIDGTLVIDNWTDHIATENAGTISLVAGQKYLCVMEYYDAAGDAVAKLSWSSSAQPKEAIPQSQVYDPPAIPPPAGRKKKACGATGLEALAVLALLRALCRRKSESAAISASQKR